MRRSLLALTLLVGVFITLGSLPAVAGATNCNAWNDPITRQTSSGYQTMQFLAHVGSCTFDTSQVTFRWQSSGFQDWGNAQPYIPCGCYSFHQAYLSGAQHDQVTPAAQAPFYSTFNYRQTCWYGSGVMDVIHTTFQYRLANLSGVWGSWHTSTRNVDEGITC